MKIRVRGVSREMGWPPTFSIRFHAMDGSDEWEGALIWQKGDAPDIWHLLSLAAHNLRPEKEAIFDLVGNEREV